MEATVSATAVGTAVGTANPNSTPNANANANPNPSPNSNPNPNPHPNPNPNPNPNPHPHPHPHPNQAALEDLIGKTRDLIDNRIERNLKAISQLQLAELPDDESFTLDKFVGVQVRLRP